MSEAYDGTREGLQRLADVLSDGVAVCKDGRIQWANQRLSELCGRPVDALLGETPESLLPPDAPKFDDEIETVVARPDGRTSAVRVARFAGAGGPATTWIFRDVARRGELEREVGELGHALRGANLEMEALRERVRRQRVDLDEVLTIVSHELRTPVTVVTGYARLLLSKKVGSLSDEQRGFVEESLKSCRRMNTFIANLLENSRDAGGDAPLQVHEASLSPTLEGVVSSLKPLFDDQGMVARLTIDPETPAARFDPLRIEQVITNLLENALKYGGPGGEITVATRPVSMKGAVWIEVSVSDEGPGVPELDRERIFERYVRVGEQSRAGGLGLGLAICRRAVEAHGGVIGVTESDPVGARFWFTLPPASEAASQAPEATPVSSSAEAE
ncbi:MAG: PAS domain-containing protein [Deltaproteobacteria bacterium]|nr:PAS domain-containing protein [Deltaproteobacteria bacterium]